MSTDPLIDEDYASEEDSDFAIDDAGAAGDASEASDSEDDGEGVAQQTTTTTTTAKRKRAANDTAVADDGYDNSGDEAIISKGKKRQKKKAKGQDAGLADEDDEGGEGGLVKTRSMRANEKAERKVAAVSGPVTVDVDALWSQLMADPVVPSKTTSSTADKPSASEAQDGADGRGAAEPTRSADKTSENESSEMIKIKRTYNFAGKVHMEEKLVPRHSAEAKVYLASLGDKAAADVLGATAGQEQEEEEVTKRKPRPAFRSMFEPIPDSGLTQRADLNLGMTARLQMREEQQAKAKKLNVVEKSRMDWAGFVDKEGIKDELELAGKSKESFASRQDFLARVEAKRDDDARKVRMAARA